MNGNDNLFHFGTNRDLEDDERNFEDPSSLIQLDYGQICGPTSELNSVSQSDPNATEFGNIQSVNDNRNRHQDRRRQKIPRTSSTVALSNQHTQSTKSPTDESRFSSRQPSGSDSPKPKDTDQNSVPTTCMNCFTQTTPLWRRTREGHPLCNACGLFFKLHDAIRPLSLKTDVIKRRNRGSDDTDPIGSATTRSSKKTSRKNPAPQMPPTVTSSYARSQQNSESQATVQCAAHSSSAVTTPASYPSGTPRGKLGVVLIAAAPPKPSVSPGSIMARPVQVTSKHKRHHPQVATNNLPIGLRSSTSIDETRMRDVSKESKAGATTKANVTQGTMLDTGVQNMPGNAHGPRGNSEDWEWLAMSL